MYKTFDADLNLVLCDLYFIMEFYVVYNPPSLCMLWSYT